MNKRITFLGSMLVVTAVLSFPHNTLAVAVQTVSGLSNGRIQITYTSGETRVNQIFFGKTSDTTLVKKISKTTVVALQANGRKLAWIHVGQPNHWDSEKISLVDDVRYTSAVLRLPDFADETIPLVVAKRGTVVDVMLVDRLDGELDIIDKTRLRNKNIVPRKTIVHDVNRIIQLRNIHNRIVERITVAGADDVVLLQRHQAIDCTHRWYETHAHMEDLEALEDNVARLDEYTIGCSLLFVGMEWDNRDDTYAEVQALVRNNPGRFVPFFNGDPNTLAEISVEHLQAIARNDTDHLFRGIGEFAFYREPLAGTLLTSNPWPDIFAWAGDNNYIIMLHLNQDQGAQLDALLEAYPNTTVLLHGKELASAGDLAPLLAEHTNLFFTLDTANMIQVDGTPLMFPVLGGNDDDVSEAERAADFVETYDANEAAMLADAQTLFADIFLAAPNQIMWGTDTAFAWHTRPAVYSRLVQFSSLFAENLTTEQSANYLTGTAQALLGDGVTLE